MSDEYQDRLAAHLDALDLGLGHELRLQIKPFFGGAAAFANNHICLSLTKVGFALKLPAADRQQLLQQGAQPLRYFREAPIKKQYVLLPELIASDPTALRPWVEKSIRFAIAG